MEYLLRIGQLNQQTLLQPNQVGAILPNHLLLLVILPMYLTNFNLIIGCFNCFVLLIICLLPTILDQQLLIHHHQHYQLPLKLHLQLISYPQPISFMLIPILNQRFIQSILKLDPGFISHHPKSGQHSINLIVNLNQFVPMHFLILHQELPHHRLMLDLFINFPLSLLMLSQIVRLHPLLHQFDLPRNHCRLSRLKDPHQRVGSIRPVDQGHHHHQSFLKAHFLAQPWTLAQLLPWYLLHLPPWMLQFLLMFLRQHCQQHCSQLQWCQQPVCQQCWHWLHLLHLLWHWLHLLHLLQHWLHLLHLLWHWLHLQQQLWYQLHLQQQLQYQQHLWYQQWHQQQWQQLRSSFDQKQQQLFWLWHYLLLYQQVQQHWWQQWLFQQLCLRLAYQLYLWRLQHWLALFLQLYWLQLRWLQQWQFCWQLLLLHLMLCLQWLWYQPQWHFQQLLQSLWLQLMYFLLLLSQLYQFLQQWLLLWWLLMFYWQLYLHLLYLWSQFQLLHWLLQLWLLLSQQVLQQLYLFKVLRILCQSEKLLSIEYQSVKLIQDKKEQTSLSINLYFTQIIKNICQLIYRYYWIFNNKLVHNISLIYTYFLTFYSQFQIFS